MTDFPAVMDWEQTLNARGCVVLPSQFSDDRLETWRRELATLFSPKEAHQPGVRSSRGAVYAARNLLELFPAARDLWRTVSLESLLRLVLGPEFGLVRGLFFDKPPERTWALPWHKDLTIAIKPSGKPSTLFSKPTLKEGVPHVEAPLSVLENMLTLRIHLDEVTAENGPLLVIPGSHRTGKKLTSDPGQLEPMLVPAGGVLAMRPLLAHCSGASAPETTRHRRTLHLEFSGQRELPDGFAWHTFIPH